MTQELTGPVDTTPTNLVTLTIDGIDVSVPEGTLVIRAAELIGIDIPRFCDHPLLEPVGACRQCLVEVPDAGNGRGMPKPQASCTLEVAPGMQVQTQLTSAVADRAQQGTLEFLLANHPLDCPVCDKGGECPLQNQAMSHGRPESRFTEQKRHFAKPVAVSEQVLLDRERCVLCQRCTRFSEEIAGDPFISLLERGAQQQIGIADTEPFHSYFSGNTIQICPVGALTSADYRFRSRPFDLISTPAIAEHDACGAAIRVDHRRGKVMRRLAGDDPEVNEEWISDKDRFAFNWYTQTDRLTTPLVRNEHGELRPVAWPAALAIAARGLAAHLGKIGVVTGGRLTVEDAYAYSKFARVALGTHNIDFRSRPHSKEEAAFLAAQVAGRSGQVSYAGLEQAERVVLVGLEPEDEASTIFLRLRKKAASQTEVIVVGSHLSSGSRKLQATLLPTIPGQEAAALAELELNEKTVVLVGERLAAIPGALSAAWKLVEASGARLSWVPRRAGDRGAIETGCLPNLLPGARPVGSAEARADIAAAWGIDSLPSRAGLDVSGMLAALGRRDLRALVVGGIDLADLPDPHAARSALSSAEFLVSLEVRESSVTELADVVLPVAPAAEKAGTFINWEGRRREFGKVLSESMALPDVRVLAGIAEELGSPIGVRTTADAATELREVGSWDGDLAAMPDVKFGTVTSPMNSVVIDTWHQLIDDGRGQDGAETYRATARPAVARISAETLTQHGLADADRVVVNTSRGSQLFDVEIAEVVTGVVWLPSNSAGVNLRSVIGCSYGDRATLSAVPTPGGGE